MSTPGSRLLLAGLLLVLVSGPAHRLLGIHYRLALLAVAAGVLLLAAGLVTGGVATVRALRAGDGWPLPLLLLMVPALGVVGFVVRTVVVAAGAPLIHDITTDMDDPPAFEALVPVRTAAGAESAAAYDGAEAARKQREAYPDIAPLVLPAPPEAVLERARTLARDEGWTVHAVDPARGRLEAVATTGWFGFRDDIVVRVRPDGEGGSRVDMRSKSRVGRGDMGANAARIRAFLEGLRGEASG